jgi:dihydrolipoamide dehydrogenase
VVLVEQDQRLGGACLNRGCIPSKALLHAALLVKEARESGRMGITFAEPRIDLAAMRAWKDGIIAKLAEGIKGLAARRNVTVLRGRGVFEDAKTLRVETEQGQQFVKFQHAIIAVGSEALMPKIFDLGNRRIMTSTEALELDQIPADLLVVGGGYIGMELGTVYASLGSRVVLVEALPAILSGADPDLVRPIKRYAAENFKEVRTGAKVVQMATDGKKVKAVMQKEGAVVEELYDAVLIAIGRVPSNKNLGLENTRVQLDDRGFIRINDRRETDEPGIYAVGDIAGGALLAHKASKEAKVAVDALCGEQSTFMHTVIPAVVYTDPELAWAGLTESEAQAKGIPFKTEKFPWSASGRALTLNRPDGMTKLIIDPQTERVLGVGIVGYGAGDLIAEGVLAIEMAATAKDVGESVHAHPTLSETLMESAEAFYGMATHSYSSKRKAAE